MQITVGCEIFSRMAEISRYPVTDQPQHFQGVYFERRNNQLFMVATNTHVGAIEYLGINVGPDDQCIIDATNDNLIKQCDDATPFGGMLDINSDDTVKWAFVKTSMGYNAPNCYLEIPKDCAFLNWRDWFPDEQPKKTNGAMHWHARLIWCLSVASPSDMLVFPEFIDITQPVVVNDANSANWIGVFMPTVDDKPTFPAKLHEWI